MSSRGVLRGTRLGLLVGLVAGWALVPTGAAAAAEPRVQCTIRDPRIAESSGLAAAGDSLYTVNDGGDRLRVFVLDRSCRVRTTVTGSLDPYDVEDLARARDGTLWLADTGDNGQSRSTVAIEQLRPDGSERLLRLTYPDGPHDAEALLLDRDGRPYVVTKEPLGSGVYTPDGTLSSRRPTRMRRVASLSFPPTGTAGGPVGTASQVLATGGAVSDDGRLVVVRTYTDAYVWSAPDGDVAAALSSGPGRRIPLPATAQGEAVAVSPDGRSLLTTTEGVPGAVHEVPLGDAAPASPDPDPDPDPDPAATTTADPSATPAEDDRSALIGLAFAVAAVGAALLLLAGRLRRRR